MWAWIAFDVVFTVLVVCLTELASMVIADLWLGDAEVPVDDCPHQPGFVELRRV